MPRGGKRNNSGRKAIWDTERIRKLVKEHTTLWWKQIAEMMESEDATDRRFALSEFNKLQVKALPQTLSSDPENPIEVGVVILPPKNASPLATPTKAGGSTS